MLRPSYLIVALLALWTFQFSYTSIPNRWVLSQSAGSESVSQEGPFIGNALWLGKDLYVVGSNFDQNTIILVNGIEQRTEPDINNPTSVLISKRLKKRLISDQVVSVQLRNGEDTLSQPFMFYTGITISFTDYGKTIKLKVGDKFLLRLADSPAVCSLTEPDPILIRRLDEELPLIIGAKAWYRAEQAGQTSIWASCAVPCSPPDICPGGGPAGLQATLKIK